MIWAVSLVVIALAVPGAWAWYLTGRQRAATTDAQRWRLARHASMVSAGVGVAILALGIAAFVITGYDRLVLALLWGFGVLHLGLLAATYRRSQKKTGKGGSIPLSASLCDLLGCCCELIARRSREAVTAGAGPMHRGCTQPA